MVRPDEAERLAAARTGDQRAFGELVQPYRHELLVHSYRILGSALEAEETVQETFLRAWRRLTTFRQEVSFRAWLYKIATNLCLDALDKRRRTLPALAFPPADPSAPVPPPLMEPLWVEPCPDEWLDTQDPETHYLAREQITLAFVAALQALPPRQRAVLILCDVLDWQAKEAAHLLDTTPSAVASALHRARATFAQRYERPESLDPDTVDKTLLTRYVQAWQAADVDGLAALLKEDATFAMPPWPLWYQGRDRIRYALEQVVFTGGGADRLLPLQASGQAAFALYRPQGEQLTACAIQLIGIAADGQSIRTITVMLMPALFPLFQLPEGLELGH